MHARMPWQPEFRDQFRQGGQSEFRGPLKCTYCDKDGHRQGPACELWCKHRIERGIPITRYVGGSQDQRKKLPQNQTPQLNAVIVTADQISPSSDLVEHVVCDCSNCLSHVLEAEYQDANALAVTRANKLK